MPGKYRTYRASFFADIRWRGSKGPESALDGDKLVTVRLAQLHCASPQSRHRLQAGRSLEYDYDTRHRYTPSWSELFLTPPSYELSSRHLSDCPLARWLEDPACSVPGASTRTAHRPSSVRSAPPRSPEPARTAAPRSRRRPSSVPNAHTP